MLIYYYVFHISRNSFTLDYNNFHNISLLLLSASCTLTRIFDTFFEIVFLIQQVNHTRYSICVGHNLSAVCLRGNVLVSLSITVVALHQVWLVLGQ